MTEFVLDCSVAMAWCFEDEVDEYADKVLRWIVDSTARVPAIWPLEVANVLLVAERRDRLTRADTSRFVELIAALPILVDTETPRRATGAILDLGRELYLSAYDAAYLELALRHRVPLATRDDKLRTAAAQRGVSLFSID